MCQCCMHAQCKSFVACSYELVYVAAQPIWEVVFVILLYILNFSHASCA